MSKTTFGPMKNTLASHPNGTHSELGEGEPVTTPIPGGYSTAADRNKVARLERELVETRDDRDALLRRFNDAEADQRRAEEERDHWKGEAGKKDAYLRACKLIHRKWQWLREADYQFMYGIGPFQARVDLALVRAELLKRCEMTDRVCVAAAGYLFNQLPDVLGAGLDLIAALQAMGYGPAGKE